MAGNIFLEKSFRERMTKIGAAISSDKVEQFTLDDVTKTIERLEEPLAAFNKARRRAVRLARLQEAERPVDDTLVHSSAMQLPAALAHYQTVVDILKQCLTQLQSVIVPELDEVLELHKSKEHPMHRGLNQFLTSHGFSEDEVSWLFGECDQVNFRLIEPLMDGDLGNLFTIADAAATGEFGIHHCGFPRLTGDPAVDRRIEQVIIRCREKGSTASLYHLMPIVNTATLVARSLCSANGQKLQHDNGSKILLYYAAG
jgi:exonuclease VII small subunit